MLFRSIFCMLIETITKIVNKYKKIGVFVSGGFDSGMLLYILNLVKKDNEIEVFVINRHPKSLEHAQPVIDFVSNRLNVKSHTHLLKSYGIEDYTVPHAISVVMSRHNLDVVLVGCVKPPEHLELSNKVLKSTMSKIQQPFFEITKDVLVQEAKELGVLELIDISNSCERSYHNPCMQCFHCLEKDWAIKQVFNTP